MKRKTAPLTDEAIMARLDEQLAMAAGRRGPDQYEPLGQFVAKTARDLSDQGLVTTIAPETALALLDAGLKDYSDCVQRLDALVTWRGIEGRDHFAQREGDLVDYNHVGNHYLAGGKRTIAQWWALYDRNEARKHLPDNFSLSYNLLTPSFDFSQDFQKTMAGAAEEWTKTLKKPKDWDTLSLDDIAAHACSEAERFHKIADPEKAIFKLSDMRFKRPAGYSPVAVVSVAYPVPLTARTKTRDYIGVHDFARRPLYNPASYDQETDIISLHSHSVTLDAGLQHGKEEKTSPPVANFIQDFQPYDQNGVLVIHAFKDHDVFAEKLLHEFLHQYHFRADQGFRVNAGDITARTGYTARDAKITHLSNHAYSTFNEGVYGDNRIETLIDKAMGAAKATGTVKKGVGKPG